MATIVSETLASVKFVVLRGETSTIASPPSPNLLILSRRILTSVCVHGAMFVCASAVWPMLRGPVARAAARGQQKLVDLATVVLQMQGATASASSATSSRSNAALSPSPLLNNNNDNNLASTTSSTGSNTNASTTWPPPRAQHQPQQHQAQPNRPPSSTQIPLLSSTMSGTLEEVVSLQRTTPNVFGQKIAAIVQRGLWWVQARVAGWFVRSIVVGGAVMCLCELADRRGFRCPAQLSSSSSTAMSWFQFYDVVGTMPGRWELRFPWLLQFPSFILEGLPLGYLPTIFRVSHHFGNTAVSDRLLATDGIRVAMSEEQIGAMLRSWRWPAYVAWYICRKHLDRFAGCIANSLRDLANYARRKKHHRHQHRRHNRHHQNSNNTVATEDTSYTITSVHSEQQQQQQRRRDTSPIMSSQNSIGGGSVASSKASTVDRRDNNATRQRSPANAPSSSSSPQQPDHQSTTTATTPRIIAYELFHVAKGAVLTAIVVWVGGKIPFLDFLPIVGGRGAAYAAASLLFTILP
ncbi:Hypothetical protein, putative [Bodo saltans]|uniref:Uncharacterized protein n=1 Tax=Bodo saltans TaxID=75058 RepID=A0A0S4JCA9_BODSA|nr:Hypothetical protein, putative [Bodo saltans]|eukprot:CUG87634.1 Hypothetical protein, putative [Bodo saltans]